MSTQDEPVTWERIAQAIERLAPEPSPAPDLKSADAYVWDAERRTLHPVSDTQAIPLNLLLGIDQKRDTLFANTMQFAKGFSANNALMWGARGMGKSSLVKSIHAEINKQMPHRLVLVEIYREDLGSLPALLAILRTAPARRFILFCDDLSFDSQDTSYKSLKTVLEGGIEAKPEHILFYATSNRRHLLPREMIENEKGTAIHVTDVAEEKISLSDRFGLWLGFQPCTLDQYLAIVEIYARHFGIEMIPEDLKQQAFLWAGARGARSGRVAWQFILDLAGKMGKKIG
jgi:uncharacterized protein